MDLIRGFGLSLAVIGAMILWQLWRSRDGDGT